MVDQDVYIEKITVMLDDGRFYKVSGDVTNGYNSIAGGLSVLEDQGISDKLADFLSIPHPRSPTVCAFPNCTRTPLIPFIGRSLPLEVQPLRRFPLIWKSS